MKLITLECDVKRPPIKILDVLILTVALKVSFSAALSLLELVEYSQRLF